MLPIMVRLFVDITDGDWFDALARLPPDKVKFWQPSGQAIFCALQPGGLFLFKLHAPDNAIVGNGVKRIACRCAVPTSEIATA